MTQIQIDLAAKVPRKRKSAAARKAEIVDTAIRLAAEIGPDRVTTQHLADAVGVTQPAIFRHFASKTDIWLAVGEHIVHSVGALHDHETGTPPENPHGTLHHIVGQHFVHVADNPAIPAILFSRELHAASETLRDQFAGLMLARRRALTRLIRHAQAQGQHRADLVPEDSAQLILAALQGLAMRWSLEERRFDLVEEGNRVVGGLIDSFRAPA